MQRIGELFIDAAWRDRNLVDGNPLMRWLRTLSTPPKTRILLGAGVQLTVRTARALVRFRREEIAKMAASWPDLPDFALWLAANPGGRNRERPVCRVKDGVVEKFVSVREAARAIRSTHDDVEKRIETFHRDSDGWTWWDG